MTLTRMSATHTKCIMPLNSSNSKKVKYKYYNSFIVTHSKQAERYSEERVRWNEIMVIWKSDSRTKQRHLIIILQIIKSNKCMKTFWKKFKSDLVFSYRNLKGKVRQRTQCLTRLQIKSFEENVQVNFDWGRNFLIFM